MTKLHNFMMLTCVGAHTRLYSPTPRMEGKDLNGIAFGDLSGSAQRRTLPGAFSDFLFKVNEHWDNYPCGGSQTAPAGTIQFSSWRRHPAAFDMSKDSPNGETTLEAGSYTDVVLRGLVLHPGVHRVAVCYKDDGCMTFDDFDKYILGYATAEGTAGRGPCTYSGSDTSGCFEGAIKVRLPDRAGKAVLQWTENAHDGRSYVGCSDILVTGGTENSEKYWCNGHPLCDCTLGLGQPGAGEAGLGNLCPRGVNGYLTNMYKKQLGIETYCNSCGQNMCPSSCGNGPNGMVPTKASMYTGYGTMCTPRSDWAGREKISGCSETSHNPQLTEKVCTQSTCKSSRHWAQPGGSPVGTTPPSPSPRPGGSGRPSSGGGGTTTRPSPRPGGSGRPSSGGGGTTSRPSPRPGGSGRPSNGGGGTTTRPSRPGGSGRPQSEGESDGEQRTDWIDYVGKGFKWIGEGLAGGDTGAHKELATGVGVTKCYKLVMENAGCTKDFFTYNSRNDRKCSCKTSSANGDAEVDTDHPADFFEIDQAAGEPEPEAEPESESEPEAEPEPELEDRHPRCRQYKSMCNSRSARWKAWSAENCAATCAHQNALMPSLMEVTEDEASYAKSRTKFSGHVIAGVGHDGEISLDTE